MSIKVKEVVKQFDGFTALAGVSLQINSGELVALLGPSGSGKTTLLRIIAGLDFPTGGKIKMDGIDASTKHVGARNVGFVFQHYALFRHMTVFENVAFGLRVKPRRMRPADGEIRERVMRLLKLVQLEGFAQRYPSQLSGGQRQRVALARALAIEPRVLLLDEPFGALDAKVRKELRRWLRKLHEEMGLTSVFVTHDQEEALELADRVVVMSNGRIEQVGTPDEVYRAPRTRFVAGFIGAPTMNLLEATREGDRLLIGNGTTKGDGAATLPLGPGRAAGAGESAVVFGIRPEDVTLAEGPTPTGMADLRCTVDVVEPLGADTLVFASVSGQSMVARLKPEVRPAPGSPIALRLDLGRSHLFTASTGLALAAAGP